jgi:hypothetical protein
MTTESASDMPGTAGLNASDYKIYLAQTVTDFDHDGKLKETQEAYEAAKSAFLEAGRVCEDPEAAQAAADEAREAADVAKGIDHSYWRDPIETSPANNDALAEFNGEISAEEHGRRLRVTSNISDLAYAADDFAVMSQEIADQARERKPCFEGLPISQSEPLLPTGTLAAGASDPLGPIRSRQDQLQSDMRADMRHPSHPDYSRFENVYAGVARIDQGRGHTSDQSSERLAAALTVQSKVDGLDAVRHVAMNPEGTRAFTIDTQDPASPLANRSSVDVAMAVRQPLEASNEKLEQVNKSLAIQQRDSPGIGLEEPIRGGLRMA